MKRFMYKEKCFYIFKDSMSTALGKEIFNKANKGVIMLSEDL